MPMAQGKMRDSMIVAVANATIEQFKANGADSLDVGEILGFALLQHCDALINMSGVDPKAMLTALRDAIDQRLVALAVKRGG